MVGSRNGQQAGVLQEAGSCRREVRVLTMQGRSGRWKCGALSAMLGTLAFSLSETGRCEKVLSRND